MIDLQSLGYLLALPIHILWIEGSSIRLTNFPTYYLDEANLNDAGIRI